MKRLNPQDISVFFTRRHELLEAYHRIREKVYVDTFDLSDYADHEDDLDHQPYTFTQVVTHKGTVIGGGRLTVKYARSPSKLTFETDDFDAVSALPALKLHNKNYAEITRLVLEPEYRIGRVISGQMFSLLIEKAIRQHAHYMFTVTPPIQWRNDRIHFGKLGYDLQKCSSVTLPQRDYYHGKHMLLSVFPLDDSLPEYNDVYSKKEEVISA